MIYIFFVLAVALAGESGLFYGTGTTKQLTFDFSSNSFTDSSKVFLKVDPQSLMPTDSDSPKSELQGAVFSVNGQNSDETKNRQTSMILSDFNIKYGRAVCSAQMNFAQADNSSCKLYVDNNVMELSMASTASSNRVIASVNGESKTFRDINPTDYSKKIHDFEFVWNDTMIEYKLDNEVVYTESDKQYLTGLGKVGFSLDKTNDKSTDSYQYATLSKIVVQDATGGTFYFNGAVKNDKTFNGLQAKDFSPFEK